MNTNTLYVTIMRVLAFLQIVLACAFAYLGNPWQCGDHVTFAILLMVLSDQESERRKGKA